MVWVLVACPRVEDATAIGDVVLAARQAACFAVFPRALARYFWPPRSGNVEEATGGGLLVFETFAGRVEAVAAIIRKHHPDQLPFIGAIRIEHVALAYREWMAGELSPPR